MLSPSPTPPTLRVGIYRSTSIGDVVLATACIDLLSKLAFPVEITWIGRQPSLGLIAQAFPGIKTVEVKRSDDLSQLRATAESLSSLHMLIDLQTNLRSRWLCRQVHRQYKVPIFLAHKAQLSRQRLLVAARLRGRRKPLPSDALIPPKNQYQLMCDALLQGLRHHLPEEMRDGVAVSTPRPNLPVEGRTCDKPWEKELKFGRWLGVAPGAAHATKQAPTETIVEILQVVGARYRDQQEPIGLAFFGDQNDRKVAVSILDQIGWRGPVLNLAGRLSLWETALALRGTEVLLSNDSALGHIAEAVDTPTAILFGPTIEGFGFAPRMNASRAFSVLLGCRPCSKHGRIPCRYSDKLCFATISTTDVASHLIRLLSGNAVAAGGTDAQFSKLARMISRPIRSDLTRT